MNILWVTLSIGCNSLIDSIKSWFDMFFQALSRVFWRVTDPRRIDSILDLGCGFGFHIPFPRAEYKVGVDIHEYSLKEAKKRFDDVILADVRKLPVRLKYFKRITLMEVLEHLERDEGEELLQRLSGCDVVLTTPLDFYDWEFWCNFTGDSRPRHKSHWTAQGLRRFGFRISIILFGPIRRLLFQTRGIIVAKSAVSLP